LTHAGALVDVLDDVVANCRPSTMFSLSHVDGSKPLARRWREACRKEKEAAIFAAIPSGPSPRRRRCPGDEIWAAGLRQAHPPRLMAAVRTRWHALKRIRFCKPSATAAETRAPGPTPPLHSLFPSQGRCAKGCPTSLRPCRCCSVSPSLRSPPPHARLC
jgi:hypothetical protein